MVKVIIALVAVGALTWWGSESAALDEIIARGALFTALILGVFPVVFIWKLVKAPAQIAAQAAADEAGRLAALSAQAAAAADQLAHSLHVSALVTTVELSSGVLEWHLTLENTGTLPIEHGFVLVSSMLDSEPPIIRRGKGQIIRPTTDTMFKWPLSDAYAAREGVLLVNVVLQYGRAGQPQLRRLVQQMRVVFKPRGVVVLSECHNISFKESPIDQAESADSQAKAAETALRSFLDAAAGKAS